LSDGSALAYARHVEGCAYLAASHLDASREPWTIAVRLLRMSDGECVGELVERFPSATPTDSIQRIARQLRDLACRTGKIHARALPSAYSLPAADRFPSYLVRLEQLLAVRCSSMEGAQRGFLSGEREILAGNLDQCLNAPTSVSVRLLLAQTLLAMKRVRPDVVAEFRERISKLQHEHRLPEPTGLVVQGVIDSAFAE
jgi:hypothetical protein